MSKLSDAPRYLRYQLSRIVPLSSIRVSLLRRQTDIRIGEDCYIGPGMTMTPFESKGDDDLLLDIRDRARISPNVTFLCSMSVAESRLADVYPPRIERITVEEDVWIGADATILAGVTIGKGSIIAAGAVVDDDVAPETVVGGVPAEKIKDVDSSDRG